MAETTEALPPLEPLKITCGSSNCTAGLHSYRPPKKTEDVAKCGCKDCGANPVDWERVRRRRFEDIDYTFSALQTEFIRHDFFFNRKFDQKALASAQKKGREALFESIRRRLEQSVTMEKPFRDGTQTPFEENVIYYAQHATATCCRKCLYIWHGIEFDRELAADETDYCVNLISAYLKRREAEIFSEQ